MQQQKNKQKQQQKTNKKSHEFNFKHFGVKTLHDKATVLDTQCQLS